ncbi:MAG: hypothetical protein Q8L51_02615 [Candidatus Amesbacteria bacterium]|nr:hypothetical protein [Candidatus Amesbacteria bacterium]
MVSYKIGTVNAYYAKLSMMAVDLTSDIHLMDTISINSQEFKIRKIKKEYLFVDLATKGETVVINADFPVAIGDELVRT